MSKIYVSDGWITVNGAHVLIGENGEVKAGAGGALKGRTLANAKSTGKAKAKRKVRGLEYEDLVPKNVKKYLTAKEREDYGKAWRAENHSIIEQAQKKMDEILSTEGEGEAFAKEYRSMKRKLYNHRKKYERWDDKMNKKYGVTEWINSPNRNAQLDIRTGTHYVRVTPKTRTVKIGK